MKRERRLILSILAYLLPATVASADSQTSTPVMPPSSLKFPIYLSKQNAPLITIESDLRLVNDCLAVTRKGTSYTIVWPDNYRLNAQGGVISVRDLTTDMTVSLGKTITATGGTATSMDGLKLWQEFPVLCPAPYFILDTLN